MRRLASLALALAGLLASPDLLAAGESVVIWPTLTPGGDGPSAVPPHKPLETDKTEKPLALKAHEIDATLRDAVQDLGFTLYVADQGPSPGSTRDMDLVERAGKSGTGTSSNAGTWVVSPRIEARGGEYLLRIVAVPPNGKELRVRVENVTEGNIAVRALVMLRDLLSPSTAEAAQAERERERLNDAARIGMMSPLRSQGRSVLAINSALFGGFLAYSVQRSSGSDDPRVLWPLLALGSGIGIGSALLVAEEWDVTTGNAWFLSAGAWWGAASGIFIANGRHVPLTERYAWGVGGGLFGLGLATVALVKNKMDDGDAMIAHSGGGVGLLWGALGELIYRGTTTGVTPYTGMGYGSAIGLVAAGVLATRVTVPPGRVLLIDAGVGIGALAGAALASPLIFENITEGKNRGFLTATLGGSIAGGVVSLILTRKMSAPSTTSRVPGSPYAGVIGASATPEGAVPAYGIGWRGGF